MDSDALELEMFRITCPARAHLSDHDILKIMAEEDRERDSLPIETPPPITACPFSTDPTSSSGATNFLIPPNVLFTKVVRELNVNDRCEGGPQEYYSRYQKKGQIYSFETGADIHHGIVSKPTSRTAFLVQPFRHIIKMGNSTATSTWCAHFPGILNTIQTCGGK